jgi:hypothetical protein
MVDDAFVLLCECRDFGELQLVRMALETGNVPLRIDGEATHGALGAFSGAAQRARVLVPPKWLPTARRIAADVVGPFDDAPLDADDDGEPGSPFREEAKSDEGAQSDADAIDDHDDDGPLVRRKMVGVPFLLVMIGLAVGFAHIYAGHKRTGIVLLALAVVGLVDGLFGQGWGVLLLVAVELFDLVGGIIAVSQYNRRLRDAKH